MKSKLTETIELLKASDESRKKLAERADVGYWWLVRLERGAIDDPGIRKIEKLYSALANQQAA